MKIIKNKYLNSCGEFFPFTLHCQRCNSEFTIESAIDIQVKLISNGGDIRTGEEFTKNSFFVKCPCCNRYDISLNREDIPIIVQDQIKTGHIFSIK